MTLHNLDTGVLIDVQRRHPPAVTWFTNRTGTPAVPGFVVMELIQTAQNTRQVHRARAGVAPSHRLAE